MKKGRIFAVVALMIGSTVLADEPPPPPAKPLTIQEAQERLEAKRLQRLAAEKTEKVDELAIVKGENARLQKENESLREEIDRLLDQVKTADKETAKALAAQASAEAQLDRLITQRVITPTVVRRPPTSRPTTYPIVVRPQPQPASIPERPEKGVFDFGKEPRK